MMENVDRQTLYQMEVLLSVIQVIAVQNGVIAESLLFIVIAQHAFAMMKAPLV